MAIETSFDYYYGDESSQFSFYRIPRQLITGDRFKRLSTDAKLLYGLLLDRMGLSAKNGWYDEAGRVYIYYTLDEIQEDLNCGHAVGYESLCDRFGQEDVDEVTELITDVLCTSRPTIRIGGEEMPIAQVRDRFYRLDSGHLEYVFDCLRRNTTQIRNIRACRKSLQFRLTRQNFTGAELQQTVCCPLSTLYSETALPEISNVGDWVFRREAVKKA